VISRFEVRNDGLRRNGIERIRLVTMAVVAEGQIAALYAAFDLSDPLTATRERGPAIPDPATPCG
jgi:hypothetical protein